MKRIKNFFSNLKLRNKFIIAYGVLLIIPLLITGGLFYSWLARVTREQTIGVVHQTIKQAELHIGHIRRQVESLGDMIFWDRDFRKLLQKKNTILYEQVEEFKIILNTLMNMEQNPKVYKVRLFVLDSKIYANNNQNIFPLSTLQGNHYFNIMMNDQNKTGWTDCYTLASYDGRKEKVISYMLVLNDFDNLGEIVGCLCIDVLEKEFSTILNEIKVADNSVALMINAEGKVLSNSQYSSARSGDISNIFSSYLENREDQTEDYHSLNWKGRDYSVINMPVSGYDWEIVYIMPTRESLKNVATSIKITMGIIATCILLVMAIAVIVSNKITRGINILINRMEKVEPTKLSMMENGISEYSKDEIGQLNRHFNLMLERLHNLIMENYEAKIQRREAELKALQAQINPHFLYNVLDSINWMAIRAGVMNISDMVTDLGQFYRIGLSRGREIISIREELEHVKTYLKIQKVRFEETLKVVIDIQEEILDYPIVKSTLQPIVENAIIHGILTKPSQEGTIKIIGEKRDAQILIKIIDDGAGVDFKKVNYILSDPKSHFSKGFGIRNVNERIKLYFGGEYGVEIKREQDKWTVVEILLPAERDIHR